LLPWHSRVGSDSGGMPAAAGLLRGDNIRLGPLSFSTPSLLVLVEVAAVIRWCCSGLGCLWRTCLQACSCSQAADSARYHCSLAAPEHYYDSQPGNVPCMSSWGLGGGSRYRLEECSSPERLNGGNLVKSQGFVD